LPSVNIHIQAYFFCS